LAKLSIGIAIWPWCLQRPVPWWASWCNLLTHNFGQKHFSKNKICIFLFSLTWYLAIMEANAAHFGPVLWRMLKRQIMWIIYLYLLTKNSSNLLTLSMRVFLMTLLQLKHCSSSYSNMQPLLFPAHSLVYLWDILFLSMDPLQFIFLPIAKSWVAAFFKSSDCSRFLQCGEILLHSFFDSTRITTDIAHVFFLTSLHCHESQGMLLTGTLLVGCRAFTSPMICFCHFFVLASW